MSTVAVLGNAASKRDEQIVRDAVHVVAEQLRRFGLAREAAFHGSAATRQWSFVSYGAGSWLASDVDIIICEPAYPGAMAALSEVLSKSFRTSLGGRASPASRVSIKAATGLVDVAEGPSLLRSGRARGQSAASWLRGESVNATGRVHFPFALEYSMWRWLHLVGIGPAENAVALHELCKGCWRAMHSSETVVRGEARTFTADQGRQFLQDHLFVLARFVDNATLRLVRAWLGARDILEATRDERAIRLAVWRMANSVVGKHPTSILARECRLAIPESQSAGA